MVLAIGQNNQWFQIWRKYYTVLLIDRVPCDIDGWIIISVPLLIFTIIIIQTHSQIFPPVKFQYLQFFLQLLSRHPSKDPLERLFIE